MNKHYQEIVDEVFGTSFYQHRTLRTCFDPLSSEWSETTIEKKVEIIKKIITSEKITLDRLIFGYKYYYKHELSNKGYVADSVENALIILLNKLIIV